LTNMNRKMRRRAAAVGGIQGKLEQILDVGGKLGQVGSQINDVNKQLGLLDQLLQEVNQTRNFASQAIQDLQVMALDQARTRFVMSRLAILLGIPEDQWKAHEETFRAEFDATSKETV